jgi:hypothetical protein
MNRLKTGQSVRVIDQNHPCFGKIGRVWRESLREMSAWIQMNEPIPENLRRFPKGDKGGRDCNIMLLPGQCELVDCDIATAGWEGAR